MTDLIQIREAYPEDLTLVDGLVFIPKLNAYAKDIDSNKLLLFLVGLTQEKLGPIDLGVTLLGDGAIKYSAAICLEDRTILAKDKDNFNEAVTSAILIAIGDHLHLNLYRNLLVIANCYPEQFRLSDDCIFIAEISRHIYKDDQELRGLCAYEMLSFLVDLVYKYNDRLILEYENETFVATIYDKNENAAVGGSGHCFAAALAHAFARLIRGYYYN